MVDFSTPTCSLYSTSILSGRKSYGTDLGSENHTLDHPMWASSIPAPKPSYQRVLMVTNGFIWSTLRVLSGLVLWQKKLGLCVPLDGKIQTPGERNSTEGLSFLGFCRSPWFIRWCFRRNIRRISGQSSEMKLLQSVDDSSLPGEWKNYIINQLISTELLNFLGEEGLGISKMKSWFCRKGSGVPGSSNLWRRQK